MRVKLINVSVMPMILVLGACASSSLENSSEYSESRIDKSNRAPASLTPKPQFDGEKIDPLYIRTQADYYFSLGEAYSLDGDSKKAIDSFKLTLVYDAESSAVNLRLAAEYIKLGMITEAIDQAEEAIRKEPKVVNNHLLLGGLYSTIKVYDKALEQYQTILKLDPKNNEAQLYIGAIYSEQRKHEKAISYFQAILKNKDNQNPHLIHYYIGRVYVDAGKKENLENAEKSFLKAISLKGDFADAAVALGTVYLKQNNPKKAIAVYKKFQLENSPNPKIAELLVQSYIDQKDYDAAYEQLEVIDGFEHDDLGVKMKMALILIEKKMYDMAVAKLEEILRIAPDADKIRFYLAAVYEELERYDEAVIHFSKVSPDSQYYLESAIHISYMHKNAGQLNKALSALEKAIKHKKDEPQLYAMYAAILDEQSEFQKALDFLKDAKEKFPNNTQILFYYGAINDRIGNKEELIATMKQVLELDPKHVQSMNYLAYSWAEKGENLVDAEKYARLAVKLDSNDGYIMDTLGWVLFKVGKTTEAIKYLEKAHKLQASVSIIAEHLGDAYLKQAMLDKAIYMYKRAIELESDSKKLDDLKAKLTSVESPKFAPHEVHSVRVPTSVGSGK